MRALRPLAKRRLALNDILEVAERMPGVGGIGMPLGYSVYAVTRPNAR